MLSVIMLQSMLDKLAIPESAGLVLLVGGLSGLLSSASFGLVGDVLGSVESSRVFVVTLMK